jgi:hypothetical protein
MVDDAGPDLSFLKPRQAGPDLSFIKKTPAPPKGPGAGAAPPALSPEAGGASPSGPRAERDEAGRIPGKLLPQVPLPGEEGQPTRYKSEAAEEDMRAATRRGEQTRISPWETGKEAAEGDIGAPSVNPITNFENMVTLLNKGFQFGAGVAGGAVGRTAQEMGMPRNQAEQLTRHATEFGEVAPLAEAGGPMVTRAPVPRPGELTREAPRARLPGEPAALPAPPERPALPPPSAANRPAGQLALPPPPSFEERMTGFTRPGRSYVSDRPESRVLPPRYTPEQVRSPAPPEPDLTPRVQPQFAREEVRSRFETMVEKSRAAPAEERLGGREEPPSPTQAPRVEQAPRSLGAAATPRGQATLPLHERPRDIVSRLFRGAPAREAQARAARQGRIETSITGMVKQGVGRVAQGLRDWFSPQGDKAGQRAASTLRETVGRGERDTAQSEAELAQFRGSVARLPEADRWALTDYMEGRSAGAKLPQHLESMRDVADTLRAEMEKRRGKLEDLESTEQMGFVEDFVHHAWADPALAREKFGVGKIGSGGFTKGRKIPTYAEGRAMGLVPKTSDPIANALDYIKNADRWIAVKEAVEVGRENGDIRYYTPGQQPPGWVEVRELPAKAAGQRVYMPEGYANIYKSFLGRGLEATQAAGVFRGLRQTQNAISMFKFALPGFHSAVMATEGAVSAVGRAMGQILHMEPVEAAKSMASALKAPIDPLIGKYGSSTKLRSAYEGRGGTALDRQIADLAARANFRVVGMDRAYRSNFGPGSLYTAFKRGTLKLEMQDAVRRAVTGGARGKIVETFKALGRVLDTVQEPLFKHYIPGMKRAAFYDRMAQFLKENPAADEPAQLRFAQQLSDSIDNRFGEMNQDNIMWNATMKQLAQLSTVSYSWELGTVREIGGGAFDIVSGKLTPKAEYVMGLAVTSTILNSVYQYLMTGEPPKDIHDAVAPRTGGKIPADKYNPEMPERARLPGYMKDVLGVIEDPAQWAKGKEGFLLQAIHEMITQTDYRGKSTVDSRNPLWGPVQTAWKIIQDSMMPITASQIGQEKVGTNIGAVQRGLGIAPATQAVSDPAGYAAMKKAMAAQATAATLRSDANILEKQGKTDQAEAKRQEARDIINKVHEDAATRRGLPPGGVQSSGDE